LAVNPDENEDIMYTETESNENKNTSPEEPESSQQYSIAELQNLRRFMKYYSDGIKFLKQILDAIPLLCDLMASNTKTEVIECMRFFVVAYHFDIVGAKVRFNQV
jgi:hypothetical protein